MTNSQDAELGLQGSPFLDHSASRPQAHRMGN
jgi:hypothetical protein